MDARETVEYFRKMLICVNTDCTKELIERKDPCKGCPHDFDIEKEDEAYDTAIKALEKQVPKTPFMEGDGYSDGELVYDTWYCPNCNAKFEVEIDQHKYCPECGQAINWEDA